MTQHTDAERADFEAWARDRYPSIDLTRDRDDYSKALAKDYWSLWQAARRAPAVPETIEQRAQKLKGLQVLIGATAWVPEAIELARSRFIEAYVRSPLHDDLAYACLLIDAYGGAPQPPEEAPVQMPEPVAEVQSKFGTTCMFSSTTMRKGDKIYTEHQVLTILAKHGIKTK